ncbi:hypothetical protein THEYE_A2027 [Thermodesulfovibrio yellowstonii DSM 11347]|uniref:Uncharacterized protein n=1 Tax=Thermodesulfovibrio yellowstonii (strain ATCC 51303 / DSM 11347 / YP87) TaxID=289376 RepID=B5YIU0_THEYD|nr:hypothetical protein THEYE_A2027 [Thermodesulfovibrio yellowstonii DSM 11347]
MTIEGLTKLYIPHGSDETNHHNLLKHFWNCLYIPHGSDETSFLT